jgi:hypothetical protein
MKQVAVGNAASHCDGEWLQTHKGEASAFLVVCAEALRGRVLVLKAEVEIKPVYWSEIAFNV